MDGTQHGSRGHIGNPRSWSAVPRAAVHPVAAAVRPRWGVPPSFAVTPTLYFHANSSGADSLVVGVESVAIPSQAAMTVAQRVS